MAEQDDASKEFEPSQKKLDDLRRKGEIPKSNDLTAAASLAGLVGAWVVLGAPHILSIDHVLSEFLNSVAGINRDEYSKPVGPENFARIAGLAWLILPWFLAPGLFALVGLIAQKSLVFAPSKLTPKLSRISPIANAGNKFGRRGIFEFLKSATKLALVSVALIFFFSQNFGRVAMTTALAPSQGLALMVTLTINFLWIVVVFYFLVGGVDLIWQRIEHLRKNRMSRQEMTDEQKQSEGDPHVKQHRRQRAQEIANNRMMADVPTADVVMVNPTHFAVALKWDRTKGSAPVCVAKGVDEIALSIKSLAISSGVPVFSDPPSARAIYSVVKIGSEISPEHYRAAAAAIRFADRLRSKESAKWKTT